MLDQLGTTPDEVALSLKAKGIRGVRNTVRLLNPIVRFVEMQLGDQLLHIDVTSGTTLSIARPDGSKHEMRLPPPVKEFLDAFNRGKYPELESDCIISIDHEGKIIEFNPVAEKLFGYRRAQVIGKQIADLIIPPSLRERHRRGLAHYLATGEGPVLDKRIEMPALRADGSEFQVELAISRVPIEGPPIFTAYLRDISERRKK